MRHLISHPTAENCCENIAKFGNLTQPNVQNNYILSNKKMVNTITIDFSITAETSLGEQVYLCGNVNELGAWDTSRALRLQTSKEVYPDWINKRTLFFTQNVSLEFKVFIKTSEGVIRWEKIQGNRKFVPTGPVLISFAQSKPEMIFQPKVVREEIGTRKNTFEIAHDLSDEVSQSSSGNQRQFWLEKITKQRSSIGNNREFAIEAKKLYENWVTDKSKLKQKVPHEWTHIIQSSHFIIKKGKNHLPRRQSVFVGDGNQTQNEFFIEKKFNLIIHQINISDLDNYVLAIDSPDSTLKLLHISQQYWNQQVIKKLERLYEGYFIVYLNRVNHNDKVMEKAQMLVINSKSLLKDCLEYYTSKRNYFILMLKQNQFLVKTATNQSIFLYFSTSIPNPSDIYSITNEYFSSIEKNLLNQKNFPLPQNLKLSLMIQNQVLRNVTKQKFNIVVLCEKLSQIPPKALNYIIRMSSCDNISINVMCGDQILEISKKFPCPKQDKIVVYNFQGYVFKPQKKAINLFEQLKVTIDSYNQIFKQLKSKANFWIQHGEISVKQNVYSYKFQCNNDCLGEQISQNLVNEFFKANTNVKFSYQIEKSITKDRKKIIIELKPTLISLQFFSRVITSSYVGLSQKVYFITFDYTGDANKFIQKMQKNCSEHRLIHEGFIMYSPTYKKGLKEEKFQQFLNQLISESYQSIIQDQLQLKKSISRHGMEKRPIHSEIFDD